MYQAVLFDLDGTLIDSADDLGAALNYVLAKHNKNIVSADCYRSQASNGTIALLKLGFGEQWHRLSKNKQETLKQMFLEFYKQHLWHKSRFYDGIKELIAHLDRQQIPWSIVTNKPAHLTEPLVAQIPEFNLCQNIVSGDTLEKAKPHADPLLHSCRLMNVEPHQCIYIGDDERDIIAANSAGMKSVAALWGYLNGNAVSSWQFDLSFKTPWLLLNHISSCSDKK
ncbi:HAD family hydrolase [Pseudoalteromonas sp. SSM20]|uniref:HAD family hydrolase n=1 Tax=Pseudoalteromonas sp. SSM20 TaxID=3139394 RepID=UPI003BAC0CC2